MKDRMNELQIIKSKNRAYCVISTDINAEYHHMKRIGRPAQVLLQHMFVRGSEPGSEEGNVKARRRIGEKRA
jgi:hypothetical protein